jgi:hypothetical protein
MDPFVAGVAQDNAIVRGGKPAMIGIIGAPRLVRDHVMRMLLEIVEILAALGAHSRLAEPRLTLGRSPKLKVSRHIYTPRPIRAHIVPHTVGALSGIDFDLFDSVSDGIGRHSRHHRDRTACRLHHDFHDAMALLALQISKLARRSERRQAVDTGFDKIVNEARPSLIRPPSSMGETK